MPTQTQAQSTIEDLRAVAANGLSGGDKYIVQCAIDLLTEFATGELAYASAADILELRRVSLISEDEAREALGLSPRKAPVATTPAAKFADEVRDASVAGAEAASLIEFNGWRGGIFDVVTKKFTEAPSGNVTRAIAP